MKLLQWTRISLQKVLQTSLSLILYFSPVFPAGTSHTTASTYYRVLFQAREYTPCVERGCSHGTTLPLQAVAFHQKLSTAHERKRKQLRDIFR